MQTFLPEPTFRDSAAALDWRRLGKQRSETFQILRALAGESRGWRNHPATRMWAGWEQTLIDYGLHICAEWRRRGYRDAMYDRILSFEDKFDRLDRYEPIMYPDWFTNDFMEAHRSNLIRKDPEFYGPKYPGTIRGLEYIWPK